MAELSEAAAMKPVSQILRSKLDQNVYSIAPTASVYDAVQQMAERNIGALVIKDGERIVGIFTERDYARKIALMGRSSRDTPISAIMTTPVMYVGPGQTNEECMALMTEARLRHLLVMDGDTLLGLVSIGDLVKDIISEQQFIIEQLVHYIMGERA